MVIVCLFVLCGCVIALGNNVPTTATFTPLGNSSFADDYKNCYGVLSIQADNAGKSTVYMAYAYSSNGVPCTLNYGYQPWEEYIVAFDSQFNYKQKGPAIGYWEEGTTTAFSMNGFAYFPSTRCLNRQPLNTGNLSLSDYELDQLPYMNYDSTLFAAEPVSNSFFYAYIYGMGQGYTDYWSIIHWKVNSSTQDHSYYFQAVWPNEAPASNLLPLNGTHNNAGPVVFFSSNMTITVVPPNKTSYTLPTRVPAGAQFLDAQVNPLNRSQVLALAAIGNTSVLLLMDPLQGKVLSQAKAGNATSLVVGWREVVAAVGTSNVWIYTTGKDFKFLGSTVLPPVGYSNTGPLPPKMGTFGTGFEGDKSAILYLSSGDNGGGFLAFNHWVRSIRLELH